MEKIKIKSLKFSGDWANIITDTDKAISMKVPDNPQIKEVKEGDEITIEIKEWKEKFYGNYPKDKKPFVDNKRRDSLDYAVQFLVAKIPKSDKDITADHVLGLAEKFYEYLKK